MGAARQVPRGCGDCRCALLNGFEIGNRAQQLAAMAEQDAQLLQILIRQIGEDAEIDPVLAKRLRVLLQTDPAEPTVNVQLSPLRSCKRQYLKSVTH